MRSNGLNKKHLKALELLRTTDLSVPEVAKQAGMDFGHLYDLIAGDPKAGQVAQEFTALYSKVVEDQQKRIQLNTNQLRDNVTDTLKKWTELNKNPRRLSKDVRKTFVDISKALNSQPAYNITSVSYSRGLTAEEMLNEFKRLRAASEGALVGGTISGTQQTGQRVLPPSPGRGTEAQEGQEDTALPTEPEAGGVS